MASTVEPCENKSSGIATLSSTLELFDTFKPSQDEEKDSDEESFHLPLLGCDDDMDSNNKRTSRAATPSAENEDDILNKFETNATPDLDPKMEDIILDGDDESLVKNVGESSEKTKIPTENSNSANCSGEEKIEDKVGEDSTCIDDNGETDEIQRLPENNTDQSEKPEDKEAILHAETKNTSETDDNTDSDVFKDLDIVDELDESFEETSEQDTKKANELDNDEVDKKYDNNEKNQETDQMDVEISEAIENHSNEKDIATTVEDTHGDEKKGQADGEPVEKHTTEDLIHTITSTEDNDPADKDISEDVIDTKTSTQVTSDDEPAEKIISEESINTENVTKVTSSDESVEKRMTEDTINTKDAMETDEDVEQLQNGDSKITEAEKINEKNQMICDEEDDIISDIVKEVNEKLDSDEDEIMTEDIQETTNDQTTSTLAVNNEILEKTDECAELDEINSSTEKASVEEKESSVLENSKALPVEQSDDIVEKIEDGETHSVSMDVDVPLVENKGDLNNVDEVEKSAEQLEKSETKEIKESAEIKEVKESDESVQQKDLPLAANGEKKEETSFESTNSLECDLLDVSIIRDVDEDNASAIAEISNDNHSSEKSDNDDQDDDKGENEMDESEVEDTLLSSDKDYQIDSEEGNSSSCDRDTTTVDNLVSEGVSDGDSKGDADVTMKETEEPKKDTQSEVTSENVATESKTEELVEKLPEPENQDKVKENGLQLRKRSFSETENEDKEKITKKLRMSIEEEPPSPVKEPQLKTLITFEKFMQNRKFGGKKLTRSDLEQFCLQKICEAIIHKTDLGDLHQTIKKQELIIENLRKDLQQLTKQTRDLDIVNKKLMSELKVQNVNKKPLVPLKITRSVGLQVKLNVGVESTGRRKQPATTPSRTPTPSPVTPANRSRNITPANANVVRQVNQAIPTPPAASPRKPQPTTQILSQALQNRQQTPNTTKRPAIIRPRPAEPAKPANPGVIDLTDEDDKTAKSVAGPLKVLNKQVPPVQQKTVNVVQNKNVAKKTMNKVVNQVNKPVNNQNKTVGMGQVKTVGVGSKPGTQTRTVTSLPQGVRLSSTQLKNGLIPASVVTSNASGTTQLMYVVQPSSLVTSTAGGAQKAVLLNFQPTNGVLASTINGSAVSMIPSKTPNNVQLKTMTAPRKHPAPLPLPAPVAVNASLKPLLPKPHLSIRKTDTGIILQWRMPYNLDIYEGIASYQLFAYQETNAPPSTDMWRKVGDVKALALPMACTLTQFADKNKYYFAVRSVDVHKRIGAFSDPEEISL